MTKIPLRFIEEFESGNVPDGASRSLLRSASDQVVRGQKTFSSFPLMTGSTESDLDFVTKEYIDSRLEAKARTHSYTFTLTADILTAGFVSLPIEVSPDALDMVRLKVEGSAGYILSDGTAEGFIVRLKEDGKYGLVDWSGNADMSRAASGEKVTVVYQGHVADEEIVTAVYTHFTETNVVDDPFEFWEDGGTDA